MACRLNGIVECDKRLILIHERAMLVMEQVKVSQGNAFVTCLLEGPSGNGKTAMTATIGIEPDFPFTYQKKKKKLAFHLSSS
ncbi:hypothetical protein BHE74_00002489 [Ensete ventricosum]|nr:hypothetical protein BHE74_00002489 [Ensete ventricosum]